jgi:hypothetical protein
MSRIIFPLWRYWLTGRVLDATRISDRAGIVATREFDMLKAA